MVPNAENLLLAMRPVQCHRSANRLVFRLPKGQIAKSCDWRHSLWASTGHLRCTPGSLVGSHLFVIYISMTLLVPSSRWQTSTALNADDTKLCRTILTMEDWYLESSLNQIRSRSNTSECKVLTVTRKKTPVTHDYLLGDENLQRIQEAMYGSWRYYF